MASGNSGYWTGSASYCQGWLEWSSTSNGSAANTSKVTVKLWVRRTDGGTSYNYNASRNFWVGCNWGSGWNWQYATVTSVSGPAYVATYTWNSVPHNADGTKAIQVAGGGSVPDTTFNVYTKYYNFTLDKIPRYANISSFTLKDSGKIFGEFEWATDSNVKKVELNINNSPTNVEIENNVNKSSGTITYTDFEPGTTYNVKLVVTRYDSGLTKTSSAVTVTTNKMPTLSDIPNFDIGNYPTVSINDSSSSSYNLTLSAKNGDAFVNVDTLTGLTGSSYAFVNVKNNTTKKNNLCTYSKNTNTNDYKVVLTASITEKSKTYTHTSEKTGKYSIPSSDRNPVCGSIQTLCNNADSIKNVLKGGSSASNVSYTISTSPSILLTNGGVTLKYMASLASYNVTIENPNGVSSTVSYPTTDSISLENNFALSTPGVYNVSVSATDSRGNNSNAVQTSFTVLPYSLPTTNKIKLARVNGFEKQITLDFRTTYATLSVNGTERNEIVSVTCSYSRSDGNSTMPVTPKAITFSKANTTVITSGYREFTKLFNNTNYFIGTLNGGTDGTPTGLDSNYSFNITFTITDKISSSTVTITVPAGVPIFLRAENGYVTVGKVPDWTSEAKFQTDTDISFKYNGSSNSLLTDAINNRIIVSETEPVSGKQFKDGDLWLKSTIITINGG